MRETIYVPVSRDDIRLTFAEGQCYFEVRGCRIGVEQRYLRIIVGAVRQASEQQEHHQHKYNILLSMKPAVDAPKV